MSADEPPSSKPPTAPSRRLAKTVGTIAVLGLMGASFALGRVTIGSNGLPEIAATLPGDDPNSVVNSMSACVNVFRSGATRSRCYII